MSEESRVCAEHIGSLNHQIMDSFMCMGKNHRSVLEKRLQETGVYRGQHHLLMCISRNPDLSQKELAKIQNVSTAAIAVSLKKLEKGGYVERVMDAKDNRSNNIKITEKGLSVVRQSIHIFADTESQTFAGFTEEEKSKFLEFLTRAGDNLKRYSCECGRPTELCFKTEREGKDDEAL